MRKLPGKRRSTVAFIAAAILVVQAFVVAWGSAAMAAQPMLDDFGNPLCVTSTVQDGTAPAGDHGQLPPCCLVGCTVASASLAAPDMAVIVVEFELPADGVSPLPAPVAALVSRDHDPGSPRAPPLHV